MPRPVARCRRNRAVAEAPGHRPDEPVWLASNAREESDVEIPCDRRSLLASAAIIGLRSVWRGRPTTPTCRMAKDYIAKVDRAGHDMDRPDHRPEGAGRKLVVYVSADQRNGGAQGVGDGAQEAAKAIGWDFRILDGQGSVPGAHLGADPGDRAEAGRHHPRHVDAAEQAPIIEQAVAAGIKVVGWHSGGGPGQDRRRPRRLHQRHHRPARSRQGRRVSTPLSIPAARPASSCSPTRSTRSPPPRPMPRRRRPSKVLRAARCWRSRTRRSAISPTAWAADDVAAGQIRQGMDLLDCASTISTSISRRRRCSRPASTRRPAIRGRSRRAMARCRRSSASATSEYQIATVAEPLHLHGWQSIDELNRAFAGRAAERLRRAAAPVHHANIDKDGGDQNTFDPGNGYREQYKKIWGVK